jgi:hypothetical protein
VLKSIAEESLDKKELKTLKLQYKEKYPEEAAYVRHFSAALVEKLIPLQPVSTAELQLLGQQRGDAIRNYFIKFDLDKRVGLKSVEMIKDAKSDAIANKLEVLVP